MAMASFWDRVATTLDLPLFGCPTTAKVGACVMMTLRGPCKGLAIGGVAVTPSRIRGRHARRTEARVGSDGNPARGLYQPPGVQARPGFHRARVGGPIPG